MNTIRSRGGRLLAVILLPIVFNSARPRTQAVSCPAIDDMNVRPTELAVRQIGMGIALELADRGV